MSAIIKGSASIFGAIAMGVIVLVAPAIVFAIIDITAGTDLYSLYQPVLVVVISLLGAVVSPMLSLIDFIVNIAIEGLNSIGFNINYRLSLEDSTDDVSEFLLYAIGVVTSSIKVGSAVSSDSNTSGGSGLK